MKIAFGCTMGSGKDTSVSYLIEKYGGIKLSFSEPIYHIIFNCIISSINFCSSSEIPNVSYGSSSIV